MLFEQKELSDYTTCIAYIDEDYKAEDQYTVNMKFYFHKMTVEQ